MIFESCQIQNKSLLAYSIYNTSISGVKFGWTTLYDMRADYLLRRFGSRLTDHKAAVVAVLRKCVLFVSPSSAPLSHSPSPPSTHAKVRRSLHPI